MNHSILRYWLRQSLSGYSRLLLVIGILLTVSGKVDAAPQSANSIQYEEITSQETVDLEVQRWIEEAIELESQGTRDSQQKTSNKYEQALRLWKMAGERDEKTQVGQLTQVQEPNNRSLVSFESEAQKSEVDDRISLPDPRESDSEQSKQITALDEQRLELEKFDIFSFSGVQQSEELSVAQATPSSQVKPVTSERAIKSEQLTDECDLESLSKTGIQPTNKPQEQPAQSTSAPVITVISGLSCPQEQGEECYRQAEAKAQDDLKKAKTNEERIKAWLVIGDANLNMGQYQLSIDSFQNVIQVDQKPDQYWEQKTLAQIGIAKSYLGLQDAVKAEDLANHTLENLRNRETGNRLPDILTELASVYTALGQAATDKQAQDHYKQAIDLYQQAAPLFLISNQREQVLKAYQGIQDNAGKLNDAALKMKLLIKVGDLYLAIQGYQEALSVFQKANLADTTSTGVPEKGKEKIQVWLGLAKACNGLERYEDAIAWAEKVVQLAEKGEADPTARVVAQEIIGSAKLRQNKYDEAYQSLTEMNSFLRKYTGAKSGLGKLIENFRLARAVLDVVRLVTPIAPIVSIPINLLVSFNDLYALTQDLPDLITNINSRRVRIRANQAEEQFKKNLEAAPDNDARIKALLGLGNARLILQEYDKAEEAFREAYKLSESQKSLDTAYALLGLSRSQGALRKKEAIDLAKESITLFQSLQQRLIGDPQHVEALAGEATAQVSLASILVSQGNYRRAEEPAKKATEVFRSLSTNQLDQRLGREFLNQQAAAMLTLANLYISRRQYEPAFFNASQARQLYIIQNDPLGKGYALLALGDANLNVGKYQCAMQQSQDALQLFRDTGDRAGQARALALVGGVLKAQQRYSQARDFYKLSEEAEGQLAQIERRMGTLPLGIRLVRVVFGFVDSSIPFGSNASFTAYKIGTLIGLADSVINIGQQATTRLNLSNTYFSLDQPDLTITSYDESRKLAEQLGDKPRQADALLGLSSAYLSFNQENKYDTAQQDALKALEIYQDERIEDKNGEAYAYLTLSQAHLRLIQREPDKKSEHYQKASEYALRSLVLNESNEDPQGVALAYSSLGDVWAGRGNEALAIVFYKQAVNEQEKVRGNLKNLPRIESFYVRRVVMETYRRLADLLLSQRRVLAAQLVLELQKIDESREFTITGQTDSSGAQLLSLNGLEKKIFANYEELHQAIKQQAKDLSAKEKKFNEQATQFEIEMKGLPSSEIDQQQLSEKTKQLVAAQPGTLLIYPLIRNDKLRLLWIDSKGKLDEKLVPATQKQIAEAVVRFRYLLAKCGGVDTSRCENLRNEDVAKELKEIQAILTQFNNWLITPLEAVLQEKQIKHLIFITDQNIRYMPLAALFDGKQYLVERYSVSTALATTLTNVDRQLSFSKNLPSVLGLGLSEATPLSPAVPILKDQIDTIVKQNSSDPKGVFPGLKMLNDKFNRESFQQLPGYQILHIATHGVFVPESWNQSFLVLGDKDKPRLTVDEIPKLIIKKQLFKDVKLVVLSACQTGLGDNNSAKFGKQDGTEIAGLAYQFLQTEDVKIGAGNVVASLWKVSSQSTNQLMEQFYFNLKQQSSQPEFTTAKALQKAQKEVLEQKQFSHPYFWAPFVVIGNGL